MYHLYRNRGFEKIRFPLTGHPNSGTVEYGDADGVEVSGSRYIYRVKKCVPVKREMYRLRVTTHFVLKMLLGLVWVAACQPESKSTFTDTKAMPKTYATTFKLRPCEVAIVEDYGKMSDASDSTPPKAIRELRDEATIHQILALAAALPDEGQIMKKMGNVPLLRTTLMYADDTIFFDFYNASVKTPSTSFYANPPREEKALYELLQSLVK